MPSAIPGIFLVFFFFLLLLRSVSPEAQSSEDLRGKNLYKVKICNVENYISLQPSESILQARGRAGNVDPFPPCLVQPVPRRTQVHGSPQSLSVVTYPKGMCAVFETDVLRNTWGASRDDPDSYARLLLIEGTVCSPRLSSPPPPKAFTLWGDKASPRKCDNEAGVVT